MEVVNKEVLFEIWRYFRKSMMKVYVSSLLMLLNERSTVIEMDYDIEIFKFL